MHRECYSWFSQQLHALDLRRRIVEIGSRNINGSLRDLWYDVQPAPEYVGIDVLPGPGVDVVASGATYQPPWAPDTVLCAEVLEHVPDDIAEDICQNALAMLAPGGIALLSMATDPRAPHSAIHGREELEPGEFYRNVSEASLTNWLRGFEAVTCYRHPRGDLYACAYKGE